MKQIKYSEKYKFKKYYKLDNFVTIRKNLKFHFNKLLRNQRNLNKFLTSKSNFMNT